LIDKLQASRGAPTTPPPSQKAKSVAKQSSPTTSPKSSEADLNAMKKPELQALCDKRKISYVERDTKATLIERLTAKNASGSNTSSPSSSTKKQTTSTTTTTTLTIKDATEKQFQQIAGLTAAQAKGIVDARTKANLNSWSAVQQSMRNSEVAVNKLKSANFKLK
jgi:DNA uptake protein ComE-like DNA-binding protein